MDRYRYVRLVRSRREVAGSVVAVEMVVEALEVATMAVVIAVVMECREHQHHDCPCIDNQCSSLKCIRDNCLDRDHCKMPGTH